MTASNSSQGASIREIQRSLQDQEKLRGTIVRLRDSDKISPELAEQWNDSLSGVTATTNYILRNLAVHLGIGASKVILPLPIGSLLRGSWVVIIKTSELLRRRPEYFRIHSLPVFLVSCIPTIGYLGYVVALRKHDPDAALLYANHVSILRYDQPLDEVLADKPKFIGSIIRRAVGIPAPS